MPPPLELSPQEVTEGQQNITLRDYSATELQAMVRKMDTSKRKFKSLRRNKKQFETAVMKENEELYYNFPSLFQMHAEDRLDATFFEMLLMKRKMERGEISTEEANTIMGQKLFQKFVPPTLGQAPAATPSMSYSEYYKQFT